jgi:hypothetical protein
MPVDSPSRQYTANQSVWQRCRDCFQGSDAVKAQKSLYLPPLGSHIRKPEKYLEYVTRAMFFNATRRTIQGLAGAIFQKAPVATVPEGFDEFLKDVTLTGVPADVFMFNVSREVLTTGRYAVLVDITPEGRPYWCGYRAEDVVSWYEAVKAGDRYLAQVVVRTRTETPVDGDPFKFELVEAYRVLSVVDGKYQAQTWTKEGKAWVAGDAVYATRRGEALTQIPIVFFGPTAITPDVEPPPMLDLVDVNLSHYRTMADLEHGRHLVALPTPWIAGTLGKGGTLEIGSGVAWQIEKGGQVGMCEFTGAGLASLVTAEQDKRKMMAVLGATLLEEQPRTVETLGGMSMRHAGEQASLRSVTQVLEEGATQLTQWSVYWAGSDAPEEEVKYELNKDFFQTKMTSEEFKAQVLALQAGTISYATFYANVAAGGHTRPGVTAEEEQEQIAMEAPMPSETSPEVLDAGPGIQPGDVVAADEGPYKIVKRAGKFLVIKADDGKVLGTHPTREAANKQLAALHANVKEDY